MTKRVSKMSAMKARFVGGVFAKINPIFERSVAAVPFVV
jgi:hypothetical protein